jgi:hypothetical protein
MLPPSNQKSQSSSLAEGVWSPAWGICRLGLGTIVQAKLWDSNMNPGIPWLVHQKLPFCWYCSSTAICGPNVFLGFSDVPPIFSGWICWMCFALNKKPTSPEVHICCWGSRGDGPGPRGVKFLSRNELLEAPVNRERTESSNSLEFHCWIPISICVSSFRKWLE